MLDVEVLHGPVLSKRLGVSDFEGRVAYQATWPRPWPRSTKAPRPAC